MDVAILRNLSGEIFLARMSDENLKKKDRNRHVNVSMYRVRAGYVSKMFHAFRQILYICLHSHTTVKYTETVAEARRCRQDRGVLVFTKFTLAMRTTDVLPGTTLDVSTLTGRRPCTLLHASQERATFSVLCLRGYGIDCSRSRATIKKDTYVHGSSKFGFPTTLSLDGQVVRRVPNESFKVRKMLALFSLANTIKGVGSREDKNGLSRCPVSKKKKRLVMCVELRLIYTIDL